MAFEEEFGSEISDSEAEKILTVGDASKLLRANQTSLIIFNRRDSGNKNIMVILSSPSGMGKRLLRKKFNKNIKTSKSQFPIQLDRQDQMKLMELITILSLKKI